MPGGTPVLLCDPRYGRFGYGTIGGHYPRFGLVRQLRGDSTAPLPTFAQDTERSEKLAMDAVMATERRLGFVPRDVSAEKLGYDIESAIPHTGHLRFIEVKGRIRGARTVTISKNEILTGFNMPNQFILAIVEIEPSLAETEKDQTDVRYIRQPFEKEPDFKATSVNYDLAALLAEAQEPV